MRAFLTAAYREMLTGPKFGPLERLLSRLFFALAIWILMYNPSKISRITEIREENAVGLARLFDLTFFANPALLNSLGIVLMMALMMYVMGRFLPIVLPIIWFIVVGTGTLELSEGAATHHLQLGALVLTGQTVWAIIWGVRKLLPKTENYRPVHQEEFFRQLMWISVQVIVATYLVTAMTKMIASEGQWVKQAKFFPLQLEKTRMSSYYNDLKDPNAIEITATGWGRIPAEVDGWFYRRSKEMESFLIESPNWSRFFMACGLLLEFGAVLVLLGRRWSLLLGASIILFHLSISYMMSLNFVLNMWLVAIFVVNPRVLDFTPLLPEMRDSRARRMLRLIKFLANKTTNMLVLFV